MQQRRYVNSNLLWFFQEAFIISIAVVFFWFVIRTRIKLNFPLSSFSLNSSYINEYRMIQQQSNKLTEILLNVYLRQPNGKSVKICLNANQTIQNLRNQAITHFNKLENTFLLIFRGQELINSQATLNDYKIGDKSIIHIVTSQNTQNLTIQIIYSHRKIRRRIVITLSETVLSLKRRIQTFIELPVQFQVIMYCGGELINQILLRQCKLVNGASLFLLDKRVKVQQNRKEWFQGKQLLPQMRITNSINISDTIPLEANNNFQFKSFKEVVSVVESELVKSGYTDQVEEMRQLQNKIQQNKMTQSVRIKSNQPLLSKNMFKSTIENGPIRSPEIRKIQIYNQQIAENLEEKSNFEEQNSSIAQKSPRKQHEAQSLSKSSENRILDENVEI